MPDTDNALLFLSFGIPAFSGFGVAHLDEFSCQSPAMSHWEATLWYHPTMNNELWLNAVLALAAIINPIGNIPLFDELTEGTDSRTRFRVYNVAILTGFITLLVLTLSGRWIMSRVFQIDIDEFRIAGGILLTTLAVKYIVFPDKGSETREQAIDTESIFRIAVVPMAVPLMVGPGSIVTAHSHT